MTFCGLILQFNILHMFAIVHRNRHSVEQCSFPRSTVCNVNSPFMQVGDDGILNVTVNGWNPVGEVSTQLSLQLNDIGLQSVFVVLLHHV